MFTVNDNPLYPRGYLVMRLRIASVEGRIISSLLAEKRSVAKQAHLGSAGKGYRGWACINHHVKKKICYEPGYSTQTAGAEGFFT
jgi:hypothetical protein